MGCCTVQRSSKQEEGSQSEPYKSISAPTISSVPCSCLTSQPCTTEHDNCARNDESSACCDRYSVCTVRFDPGLTAICETTESSDTHCAQDQSDQERMSKRIDHALPSLAGNDLKKTSCREPAVMDLSRTDRPVSNESEDVAFGMALTSDVPEPTSSEANNDKDSTNPPVRSRSLLKSKRCLPKPDLAKTVPRATESSAAQQIGRAPGGKLSQRAQNREARLIDGTIFVPRPRRSKTVSQPQFEPIAAPETSSRNFSARLSWSPREHRDSIRSKWTHELRHLFHRGRQSKTASGNKRHHSVPASSQTHHSRDTSEMSNRHNKSSTLPASVHDSAQPHFGFDGVSDVPAYHISSFNLNKPLPLNPEDIVKSMSSRTQTLTSQYSDSSSNLPSATSITSSASRNSSRKDFRGLTRDLLHSAMPSQHELPPIREASINQGCIAEPQKSSRAALS